MPNPFAHIELSTDDVKKAKKFYQAVFAWKLNDMPAMAYTMIDVGGGVGGGMQKVKMPGQPSAWLPYVQVDDVEGDDGEGPQGRRQCRACRSKRSATWARSEFSSIRRAPTWGCGKRAGRSITAARRREGRRTSQEEGAREEGRCCDARACEEGGCQGSGSGEGAAAPAKVQQLHLPRRRPQRKLPRPRPRLRRKVLAKKAAPPPAAVASSRQESSWPRRSNPARFLSGLWQYQVGFWDRAVTARWNGPKSLGASVTARHRTRIPRRTAVDCLEIRQGFSTGEIPSGASVTEHLAVCARCRELFMQGATLGRCLASATPDFALALRQRSLLPLRR